MRKFGMKEIIELSKCGDVMMSFNCQTEREPVVAQGPSVPCAACFWHQALSQVGLHCSTAVHQVWLLLMPELTAHLPHITHPQVQISQIHFSSLSPAVLSLDWPWCLRVSLVMAPLHEISSPLTHCWHEPGTDYCDLSSNTLNMPAGPAQAHGVQWAQGRGSIGPRRGVSCSHDSQRTVKATWINKMAINGLTLILFCDSLQGRQGNFLLFNQPYNHHSYHHQLLNDT